MEENAYKTLEESILKDICNISAIKEGIKKGLIEVILKSCSENTYTWNGTFKRKIEDFRRKV